MQAHIYKETDIEVTLRFEMNNGELLSSKMKQSCIKLEKSPFGNVVRFLSFPAWKQQQGDEIVQQQCMSWIKVRGRSKNITFNHILKNLLCDRSGFTGMPPLQQI